jgi:hypothetical protein
MRMRIRAAAIVAALTMSLAGATSAQAQTTQEGLVNVAVEDVIVQAPIALAANVCDVNVAVLAEVADDAAACEATADSAATAGPSGNGPTRQDGLVNVLVDDVLVQLPISVAANVCDVNVAILAQLADDSEACTATADAIAQPGSGPGGANAAFDPASTAGSFALDNNLLDDGGQGNIIIGTLTGLLGA